MKRVVGTLLLFIAILISGCMIVPSIRLYSTPPGAAVYLVPKIDFEMDQSIMQDQGKLEKYRVSEGDTPVVTRAYEKRYIVVFVKNGKVEKRELDVLLPPHNNEVNVVFP